MTYEHAKAKLATTDTKIDFFAGLTEQIERMIDEIETARHDNVLWNFSQDWTLADNVEDGWDASETACEGLGYLREVCEQQLNRERNKADKLNTYLTRLEGQASPATVTANSVDIDDDGAHCFECGKYVADAHDMNSGMWVQPSHESGTSNGTGCYAEFVCRECYDKHYHQCDECCESYHESRCTQDTNGNFICENCREAQAATDKVTANSVDIDDEDDTYHAWHWTNVASFRATVSNLGGLIWSLQFGLDATHRMLNQRDDAATTDEEIAIVNADFDRLYEIEERLEQAEEAVENLRKISELIDALGTPADDGTNDAE